jgi:hypothetical protein
LQKVKVYFHLKDENTLGRNIKIFPILGVVKRGKDELVWLGLGMGSYLRRFLPGTLAHTYNYNYSGSGDWENQASGQKS